MLLLLKMRSLCAQSHHATMAKPKDNEWKLVRWIGAERKVNRE